MIAPYKVFKKITLLIIITFFGFQIAGKAQTGTISGKITDKKTGESLIGVSVLVKEEGTGAATNVNGKFYIKDIDPGSYTLQVTYVSYQKKIIEDVKVKPNEVTTLNIELAPEDMELEEVTIKAKQIDNTEAALLSIQKKSLSVKDGISSEQMSRLGASDAAESMKKVTGASVEDGKYMVIRGLGDRYSITQMNNVTMPSADPYRNSTSMDLIPSNMVDNITTSKTFTPDQPGNFTGGRVNINTKSFPEKYILNFGISTGYNTNTTFNENFIKDRTRGSLDYLGYDDGSRSEPEPVKNDKNRDVLRKGNTNSVVTDLRSRPFSKKNTDDASIINKTSKSFKNPYHTTTGSVPLNQGINFSIGNQYDVGGNPLGVMAGINYSRKYENYSDDAEVNLWNISDGTSNTMQPEYQYSMGKSTEKSQIGAIASMAYQLSTDHEISLDYMYNHKGISEVTDYSGTWRAALSNPAKETFHSNIVKFEERGFHNLQLKGKHNIKGLNDILNSNLKTDWVIGYTRSMKKQPDLRMFPFVTNDSASRIVQRPDGSYKRIYFKQYKMNKSETDLPYNYFRDLQDNKFNVKANFELPFTENKENLIKFGFSYSNTQRNFDETYYQLTNYATTNGPGISLSQASGDFDSFFDNSNYGITHVQMQNGDTVPYSSGIDTSQVSEYFFGNVMDDQTQVGNSYTGHRIVTAGYLMADYQLTPRLNLTGGFRIENTDLKAESASESKETGRIKEIDLLPSLNAKYALTEKMNLRMAITRTLARPNMREIGPFTAFGGVGFASISGNSDLERTLIQNYDFRWELFPNPGEIYAFSAYYKRFDQPLMWQLFPQASSAFMQPINVDKANVYGAEFEIRKSLGFITSYLQNMKFNANFSYIYSKVPKSQSELNRMETTGRSNLKSWRPFQNQSPYIVNASLSYLWKKISWENTLSFNIWGPRLTFVTQAEDPDVYEQPRPSLDFISNKKFGKHYSLGFQVTNILNMTYLFNQDFKGTEFVRKKYRLGTTFNLSFSYKI